MDGILKNVGTAQKQLLTWSDTYFQAVVSLNLAPN
jgi:hypothetical protein